MTVDSGVDQPAPDSGLPPQNPDAGVDNRPPMAVAVADRLRGEAPLTIELSAVGSTDPDNDISAYRWQFGDQTTESTEAVVSHTYVNPGTYPVVLSVFDSAGQVSHAALQIIVDMPPDPPPMRRPPVAVASGSPTSGQVPLTVTFSSQGSSDPDNDIEVYTWTFDDGSSSQVGTMVTHTYTVPGNYTARVIVTDRTGQSDIAEVPIVAERAPGQMSPPVARATASVMQGNAPLNVTFSASGSTDPDADIVGYAWDFGDGSPVAQGVNQQHVFQSVGTFTVTLTVQDSTSLSSQAQLRITVNEAPPNTTCPEFNGGSTAGVVQTQLVQEASGIVASRQNANVIWTHNDSGDANRLYALSYSGAILGAYNLNGSQAVDWEDIAIGPGPQAGVDYVYVGDIGDNNRGSNIAPIYRFPEPSVSTSQTPAVFDINTVETIVLRYPNGGAHNAETLLVDPLNGDIWIVSKHPQGASIVFRAEAPFTNGQTVTVTEVTTLQFPGRGGVEEATGGDISADGSQIIIRTYGIAYIWLRQGATPLAQVWGNPVCVVNIRAEPQGEAVGFLPDSRNFFTFSEGVGQPIYRFDRTN